MSNAYALLGIPDLPERAFQARPGGKLATLEGGKGNSAPPPDPRLVEAQIRSMGIQDEMMQRIIANSDTLLPLQQEQLQYGLDAARRAEAQSQEDRDWMLERRGMLGGMQNRLVEDAAMFDSEQRRRQLAGEAMADVNQAFTNARGQGSRELARMGVNPNSGRSLAMNNVMSIEQAKALANAANKTREAARQEGFALTDRATNALAGYPAMGMQATQQGAGFGMAGLGLANQGLAGMNSGYGAAGGLAGQMGQNATSMWGAQANYHSNMQQQGDTIGGILGGLGGLAAGAAQAGWISDRRLKQDIQAVGRDERTGLTLYEFAYRDVPHRRWRGVMADEVRERFPHAVAESADGYMTVDYRVLGIEMQEV